MQAISKQKSLKALAGALGVLVLGLGIWVGVVLLGSPSSEQSTLPTSMSEPPASDLPTSDPPTSSKVGSETSVPAASTPESATPVSTPGGTSTAPSTDGSITPEELAEVLSTVVWSPCSDIDPLILQRSGVAQYLEELGLASEVDAEIAEAISPIGALRCFSDGIAMNVAFLFGNEGEETGVIISNSEEFAEREVRWSLAGHNIAPDVYRFVLIGRASMEDDQAESSERVSMDTLIQTLPEPGVSP